MRRLSIPVVFLLASCNGGGGGGTTVSQEEVTDIRGTALSNPIAYIPSQCFTKTEDDAGGIHNPCFACHIASQEPNYIDDGDVQLAYAFPGDPDSLRNNPWTNLLKDRSAAVATITDDAIMAYVRQDNYLKDGSPLLAATLSKFLPTRWDVNANGVWDGYKPDAYFNFDNEGFDRSPDNGYTGWRAFAYALFLGTFWPTNGSTDDVLVRLAPAFRQSEDGSTNLTVYKTNLAIVTAMIQRRDVTLETAVDETALNVDLDKDGKLASASLVRYDWAPLENRLMSYVGKARLQQQAGEVHLAAGLFPEGTEFLHSVRYLDMDDAGATQVAKRLKELRYAIKRSWYTYSDLKAMALKEVREASQFPERTRQLTGNAEIGISNGQGWTYQGFIEDKKGQLRPQTYEETAFCIGCHSGLGATTDSAFAYPRKFRETTAFRQSWYHWTQKGLVGTPEPIRSDAKYEYTHYLQQNGAGDEFRGNEEVKAKFFNADGSLKADMIAQLHNDVTVLLNPSRARALALNKAYKILVEEQSFAFGRDAPVTPVETVHKSIRIGTETGITEAVAGPEHSQTTRPALIPWGTAPARQFVLANGPSDFPPAGDKPAGACSVDPYHPQVRVAAAHAKGVASCILLFSSASGVAE
jgi:hypothetical protein